MPNAQKFTHKDLYCTTCGTHREVLRRQSRNKSDGHTKHLFCLVCGKETAHAERTEFDARCP